MNNGYPSAAPPTHDQDGFADFSGAGSNNGGGATSGYSNAPSSMFDSSHSGYPAMYAPAAAPPPAYETAGDYASDVGGGVGQPPAPPLSPPLHVPPPTPAVDLHISVGDPQVSAGASGMNVPGAPGLLNTCLRLHCATDRAPRVDT